MQKSNPKIIENFKIVDKHLNWNYSQYEIVINQAYYTRFLIFRRFH